MHDIRQTALWIELQNDEDKSVHDYERKKSALDEVNQRMKKKPLKPNPVLLTRVHFMSRLIFSLVLHPKKKTATTVA